MLAAGERTVALVKYEDDGVLEAAGLDSSKTNKVPQFCQDRKVIKTEPLASLSYLLCNLLFTIFSLHTTMPKPPSEADIIFNRAAVALAKSQRLIASWLPPPTASELANAKTEEELEREEQEIFTPVPET